MQQLIITCLFILAGGPRAPGAGKIQKHENNAEIRDIKILTNIQLHL